MPAPERFDLVLPTGTLAAYRWPGDGPTVLAAHGITSNHRSWGLVAEALGGDVTLVAPDLRGRGRSNRHPGPYGVADQADDLAAILDHLSEHAAVVAGHSMGGFVATAFAERHPQRALALVLVDGGPPLAVPPGVNADEALASTLGPALARLKMTFPDREAYREFWQRHPSFEDIWSDEVDAHVQHDLVGDPPAMRSSCVKDAVRLNGRELLASETVRTAISRVACPVHLLWAPKGMLDQPGGLYDPSQLDGLSAEEVPGTNHYSILLGPDGAAAVAAAIRRAVAP
jgi:pimeloyl-ACP methyl ester carboxylesterase